MQRNLVYFQNIKSIELDKGNWKQKKKELSNIQIKEYWYHKMKKMLVENVHQVTK